MKLPIYLQTESFRQTLWALSGNLGYAFAQWGMLIVLTRYTSPSTVGQYALALAICAPVIMFSNMRLRLLLAADAHNDFEFSTYRQTRLITSFVSLILITFVSFIVFGESTTFFVIFIIATAKSIEAISDIYYGLFQKHKTISLMCMSLLIKGAASFTLFYLFLKYTNNIYYAYLSLAFSWLALLVLFDMSVTNKLLDPDSHVTRKERNRIPGEIAQERNIKARTSASLAKSAILLGFVALVGSLFSNVTRYIIGSVLGETQLGIYAAIAYIGVAGQLVAASLVQPIMPNLASNYRNGNLTGFSRNYRYLLIIAVLLGLSGIGFVYLVGEYFLFVVYGQIYSKHNDIFMLAIISSSFGYFILFQWYVLTAMKKLKEQLVLSVLTIVVLLLLSLYLTPKFGISGAIGSEIVAMTIHVVLGLWVVRKHVKLKLQS